MFGWLRLAPPDNLISRAMRKIAKMRAEKLGPKRLKEIASKAGQAAWKGLTPEQRSAEMKRRAKKRKRKD